MKVVRDAYNWLIRLERGESLVDGLTEAVKQEGIKTGMIFGIGACSSAELGFYNLDKKQYSWKKYDEPMEILSLQGNVSLDDGQLMLHIHGSFAGKDQRAVGGHVRDLIVAGTCEIFLHDWFADGINRKTDPDTGLKLLDL